MLASYRTFKTLLSLKLGSEISYDRISSSTNLPLWEKIKMFWLNHTRFLFNGTYYDQTSGVLWVHQLEQY